MTHFVGVIERMREKGIESKERIKKKISCYSSTRGKGIYIQRRPASLPSNCN
jgi:hypothetical protein